MKKIVMFASLILVALISISCSSKEVAQLSLDDIGDLPLNQQVESIIDNTGLIEEYKVITDDNSIAIVYPTEYIADSNLVSSDKADSFPRVAMTFAEHLAILSLDEVVVTSYEPTTGLTKVSAWLKGDTIKELDFSKWKEESEKHTHKAYRYFDGYLIRGNVWENQNEDIQEAIRSDSKSAINTESQFWEYYGSYVE